MCTVHCFPLTLFTSLVTKFMQLIIIIRAGACCNSNSNSYLLADVWGEGRPVDPRSASQVGEAAEEEEWDG